MQIHMLDVDQIDIPERFRENPAEDIESLMQSIKERGLIHPIVVTSVNGTPQLICGRRRMEAHIRLRKEDQRFATIPAIFKEDLSERERRIIELEENVRRVDFSDAEKVKAINEIHRLFKQANENWTMEQTAHYLGFKHRGYVSMITTIAEHIEAHPDGSAAQALQEGGTRGNILRAYKVIRLEEQRAIEAALEKLISGRAAEQAERGDEGIERRAKEIIKRGNCLDLIKQLEPESVYLLHTDPPYGIEFDKLEKGDSKDEMYKGDTLEASKELWSALAPEIFRVMQKDSFGVIWASFVQMPYIREYMEKAGFTFARKPFVWVKLSGSWVTYVPTKWFASAYDTALIFAKGDPVLVEQGRPDFCIHPQLSPEEKTHPLERPIPLLTNLIGRFIIPGQVVLDPFAGSGSTLVATLELKGEPIGFELDEGFYNAALMNVVKALRKG